MTAAHQNEAWPDLPWTEWRNTCVTLQLWMQVVGKIRLALTPKLNHSWNVTLYVTCRGLTTAPMPYGNRMLQIDFDFLDHLLLLQTSDGAREVIPLNAMSVAVFYREVMERMRKLGIEVHLWTTPAEVANPIPFEQDETHHASPDGDGADCISGRTRGALKIRVSKAPLASAPE